MQKPIEVRDYNPTDNNSNNNRLKDLLNNPRLRNLGLSLLIALSLNLHPDLLSSAYAEGAPEEGEQDKCLITPKVPAVNLREGPGVNFTPLGLLEKDEIAEVRGIDPNTNWQLVFIPQEQIEGWVTGSEKYIKQEGSCDNLPEVTPPPLPTPSPSQLTENPQEQTQQEISQPEKSEAEKRYDEWAKKIIAMSEIDIGKYQIHLRDYEPLSLQGVPGIVEFSGSPEEVTRQLLEFIKPAILELPEEYQKFIEDNILSIRKASLNLFSFCGKGIACGSGPGSVVALMENYFPYIKSECPIPLNNEEMTDFLRKAVVVSFTHEGAHNFGNKNGIPVNIEESNSLATYWQDIVANYLIENSSSENVRGALKWKNSRFRH